MRKVKRAALSVFMIMLALSLPACAVNMTKHVSGELRSPEIYQERNIRPVDMKSQSKCDLPPSVNILNAETRTTMLVMEKMKNFNINPRELTDGIVDHMKAAFDRCGVKSDAASKKVIRVSMGETLVESPFIAEGHSAMTHLQIDIPDIRFNRFYQGEDTTTKNREQALALAIHRVVWKVIVDEDVRDYILCRQNAPITQ